MVEKFLIIVDNDPQDANIEVVRRTLHSKGILLSHIQLDPIQEQFLVFDEETKANVISIEKIKAELNTPKYLKRGIVNMLACDYRFKETGINGFDVVLSARELGFDQHSLIYSGGLSKIIEEIFESQATQKERIRKIERLVKAQARFIPREEYEQIMIEILGTKNTFNFNLELEGYLLQFPEHQFLGEFSLFHEKKFQEIASLLKKPNDPHSYEFKKEFVERAFSIMIDLNTPQ
jgi:hypothetical protein